MHPDSPSPSDVTEYPPMPDGARDSPEWRAALELNERAQLAQGRLALGCCIFWLDGGGYLLTVLPPMADVRGNDTWMLIYTAEHLIRLEGENLHLLAWQMKLQRIDDLRATQESPKDDTEEWTILSITAEERDEE